MKKTMAMCGAALFAIFAGACAPEAEGVCKHEMKVYEGSSDQPGYLVSMEECVKAYENKKTRRGVNSYRREVECVLASDTQYKIRTCQENEARRANK